ncbi:hypothetical protein QFC20_007077 [Naganishia adeliensis]|uniref:Uncharacterized protein n=1 Tax=Naganishia adeliensis TaxID=92952 RepID=A0ACC2V2V6_9TREE|nr:hypothetical protein QFC20_007077 [Naganishia adeliensis]
MASQSCTGSGSSRPRPRPRNIVPGPTYNADANNSWVFDNAEEFQRQYGAAAVLTEEELQVMQQADDDALREAIEEGLRIDQAAVANQQDVGDEADLDEEKDGSSEEEQADPPKMTVADDENAFAGGIADRVKRRDKNDGVNSAAQDDATQGKPRASTTGGPAVVRGKGRVKGKAKRA